MKFYYILFLLISGNLIAADKNMGIGIGFQNQQDFYGVPFEKSHKFNIYLPIKSENLMIEPNISYFSASNANNTKTRKARHFGIGFFHNVKNSPITSTYYGARIGYKDEYGHEWSDYDHSAKYITPTIGGEYFLNENMSIGVEAGFEAARIKSTFLDYSDASSYTFSTRLILRSY